MIFDGLQLHQAIVVGSQIITRHGIGVAETSIFKSGARKPARKLG